MSWQYPVAIIALLMLSMGFVKWHTKAMRDFDWTKF